MTIDLTQQQLDLLSDCILSHMRTLRGKNEYFISARLWKAVDQEIRELADLHSHLLRKEYGKLIEKERLTPKFTDVEINLIFDLVNAEVKRREENPEGTDETITQYMMDIMDKVANREDKKYYCECGNEMNEGEARTFTCCEVCWDKHYKEDFVNTIGKDKDEN